MTRRQATLITIAAMLLFAAACTETDPEILPVEDAPDTVVVDPDETVDTVSIEVVDLAFVPAAATASGVDAITVTNADNVDHTFTMDDLDVDVDLPPGASEEIDITAAAPGTWEYHCEIHPEMTGSLTVS